MWQESILKVINDDKPLLFELLLVIIAKSLHFSSYEFIIWSVA